MFSGKDYIWIMVGSFTDSITYLIKGISCKQIRNGRNVSVLNPNLRFETMPYALTRYFQKQNMPPEGKLRNDYDIALVRAITSTRSLPHNKYMIFLKISMKVLQGKSVEVCLY